LFGHLFSYGEFDGLFRLKSQESHHALYGCFGVNNKNKELGGLGGAVEQR
jgi:hypothetical protein